MTIAPGATATNPADLFVIRRRRGMEPEEKFAHTPIMDDCIDAGIRASRNFSDGFPGWQLHSRIYRGERLFDRQLAAWAVGLARSVARARKENGQAVIAKRGRRNDWIMQAGLDALTIVIKGREPATPKERARELGADDKTFTKLRNLLAAGMLDGWNHYDAEAKAALLAVERANRKIYFLR